MSIYANHVDVSVCSFGSLHFTLPFRHKLNNKKYIFIHLYTLKLTHNANENILPHIYATNFLQISCHIYIVIVSPTVCLCIVVRYSSIYFLRALFLACFIVLVCIQQLLYPFRGEGQLSLVFQSKLQPTSLTLIYQIYFSYKFIIFSYLANFTLTEVQKCLWLPVGFGKMFNQPTNNFDEINDE